MFSKKNNITQNIYSIKDAGEKISVFLGGILMFFFSIISLLFSFGAPNNSDGTNGSNGSVYAMIFGLFSVLLYFRYGAIREGYKLNLDNRTFSFPGGGNAANDITDYVNPNFLLQSFMRKSIDLNAISEIRRKDTKRKLKGKVYETHLIEFVGTFGGTQVKFSNKAKRDELYNAIRLSVGMGTPIFAG